MARTAAKKATMAKRSARRAALAENAFAVSCEDWERSADKVSEPAKTASVDPFVRGGGVIASAVSAVVCHSEFPAALAQGKAGSKPPTGRDRRWRPLGCEKTAPTCALTRTPRKSWTRLRQSGLRAAASA